MLTCVGLTARGGRSRACRERGRPAVRLRSAGEGLVETSQASGEIAGEVEDEDAVLLGLGFVEFVEGDRAEAEQVAVGRAEDGGGAGQGFEEAHFAEEVSFWEGGEGDGFWGGVVFDDADGAAMDEEEPVTGFAFAHDDFAAGEGLGAQFGIEEGEGIGFEAGEQGEGGQGGGHGQW